MKRSLVLTFVALSVFGISAHAQKRRGPARSAPAQQLQQAPPSSQNGQVVRETICKGLPIPAGYVTAGETADSSCAKGAWILKKRGTRLAADPGTPTRSSSAPVTGRRVSLKEVSTDLVNYLQQPLTVTGELELSDWYFGPYYKKELEYYAFSLSDGSGERANVYVRRDDPFATNLRNLLSRRGTNVRARGSYTFIISQLDGDRLSGHIYAELLSSAPPEENEPTTDY